MNSAQVQRSLRKLYKSMQASVANESGVAKVHANYRAHAVGNALLHWEQSYLLAPSLDATRALEQFRDYYASRVKSASQVGTKAGFAAVVKRAERMLSKAQQDKQ